MWLALQNNRSRAVEVLDARDTCVRKADGSDTCDPEPSTRQIEDRITAYSPEGRPEHSEFGGQRLLWLVIAPIGSIAVLAVVVYFIWGLAAAGLVFVFGLALACLGNPEVWATFLRAQEREEIAHPHATDEENAV